MVNQHQFEHQKNLDADARIGKRAKIEKPKHSIIRTTKD